MDYEEQSRKDKPFEGLSLEEAKRLFVYMCYVAHPRLTPEDVEKRWGKILPPEEIPTVFEAMEIAEKMKQTDNHFQQDSQVIVAPPAKGATARKAVAWILFILCAFTLVALSVLHQERVAEIRRQEELRKAEIRKQEEMQKAEIRKQEEMQKAEIRKQEQQLKQEATALIDSATSLLSSPMTLEIECLEMGIKLQDMRARVISNPTISRDTDLLVQLDESLLRCYKKARGNKSPKSSIQLPSAVEACYRIALLYLPSSYFDFVVRGDRVARFSENHDVSMQFLQEAVECEHYKALSLYCRIRVEELLKVRQDIGTPNPTDYAQRAQIRSLEQLVSIYRRQLASHKEATGRDVYLYAKWISKTDPDEALEWFKKAARMSDMDAKKELLLQGVTFDE